MYRLARYDIGRRFAKPATRLLAQLLFGFACALVTIGLLMLAKAWLPLSGPFAFLFPAIVIATLYGHWQGGLSALVSGLIIIWRFVLPYSAPLSFTASSDAARVTTAGVVGLVMLILVETFRSQVARAARERDTEIARGEMLLRELEHRTRNNFGLVASLLEFQRRQSDSPEVRHALDDAIGRVYTFADAYSQLGTMQSEVTDVAMRPYLSRLLDRVGDALFGDQVKLESEIADVALPSQKAVAIGLYLNEALTNCAKYAFPEGKSGQVRIALGPENGGWRLTVADNGVGEAGPSNGPGLKPGGGLGAVLFEALAAQAGAKHVVTLPGQGRRLDLVSVN